MKKFISNLRIPILIVALFVLVANCSSDDDGGDPTAESILVGLWTSTQSVIDANVGAQSVTEYLENVVGLSPEEAGAAFGIWQAEFQSELIGSITFKSDHTYQSNFGSSPDDGTWSLSSDGKALTLDIGTIDEQTLVVVSLASTTFVVIRTEDIMADLDDDTMTPDVLVKVDATITLTK